MSLSFEKVVSQIDGHWKDDGGVVLGGDAVQSLQISQLKTKTKNYDESLSKKKSELVC